MVEMRIVGWGAFENRDVARIFSIWSLRHFIEASNAVARVWKGIKMVGCCAEYKLCQ
jgi:hypothetical protein